MRRWTRRRSRWSRRKTRRRMRKISFSPVLLENPLKILKEEMKTKGKSCYEEKKTNRRKSDELFAAYSVEGGTPRAALSPHSRHGQRRWRREEPNAR